VCVGSFMLVPAANRKAAVRGFGAELAAIARPDDYLVVDQEGYEQILFYARMKGARRDPSDLRLSWEGDRLVMETGSGRDGARTEVEDGGDGAGPSAQGRRLAARDASRASFAGELERAHRRV